MKSFDYIITDEIGIHARPAGLLVKEAKPFTSMITLTFGGKKVDVKKLMALMALGITQGSEITVTAEGDDEEEAIVKIEEFFKTNL
ncbi:MAG: HPr family phosphocarrier protein [Clostridiales bacterium]|nr:HPr family phosphocarrier protein [Clostridiales bacterium]